jgi:hypothetical protein
MIRKEADGMATEETGMCDVCGRPGCLHLTEIRDGVQTTRTFCGEHVPPEMRDKMPFGPHRTPAEEVAFLRRQMQAADQQISDPVQRAGFNAEIEALIADIEAGRRRMGEAD